MYNPQSILDLLEARGLKRKDLLNYLNKNKNASLTQVLSRNIGVNTLESIADFFGVPIDTFFNRKNPNHSVNVNGTLNSVHNFNNTTTTNNKYENSCSYDIHLQLIEEKDKRIAALEKLIALYENQHQ